MTRKRKPAMSAISVGVMRMPPQSRRSLTVAHQPLALASAKKSPRVRWLWL
ncbi:hypothetical protein D9M73_273680 [compost metagenome]